MPARKWQDKMYVGLHFPCMGSGIKQTELNGSLLEHTVQVQTMVSAVVIMPVAAIISLVPDVADLRQGLWLFPVQTLQKIFFHFPAITMFTVYIHL